MAIPKGVIFDIKKFAVHDGPGIRTTVFMKGCPLRCAWCHNPESWKGEPEILFYEQPCIGCGKCFEACPSGALRMEEGKRVYRRDRCEHCYACVNICYAEATVKCGREVTVAEVLTEVEKDRPFYENSGGGMTVSGGEPMMQAPFVFALMEQAKSAGLHTALDTSGCIQWDVLKRFLKVTDLFLYDLKLVDETRHRAYTGVSNRRILANLRQLSRAGASLLIRMPVVPGYTDGLADVAAAGEFLSSLDGDRIRVQLLPYHRLAEGKYDQLESVYPLKAVSAPPKEQMNQLKELLSGYDLDASVGG
ncbi:MAG: glycyl-radical enzyme activating protein [Candidatus Latescibacterota bacterium]